MKSEVIVQKSHRFGYDHAVSNCGVRLVEVETAGKSWSRRSANTRHDALLQQQQQRWTDPRRGIRPLGKKHAIPTLNDAAADVPPVENLWKYTKMGFDLVAFSGGKGIRGPQSAGLLLGPKHLIAAARLNGPPNGKTIGRGMKVNKEEMLGMLVGARAVSEERSRERAARSSTSAPR